MVGVRTLQIASRTSSAVEEGVRAHEHNARHRSQTLAPVPGRCPVLLRTSAWKVNEAALDGAAKKRHVSAGWPKRPVLTDIEGIAP